MKQILATLIAIVTTITLMAEPTTKEQILALVPHNGEVYRHGYSELNNDDKAIYNTLLAEILQFDDNKAGGYIHYVYPTCQDFSKLQTILSRMYEDVPELWILSSSIPGYDNNVYKPVIRIQTLYTPDNFLFQLMQLDTAYQHISKDFTPGMSDYEKMLILHNGYIDWNDYGNPSGGNSGNVKGSLIERKAICEGFARGFLYLCQKAGLTCIYIVGQNSNGNHAWNFVELDGGWYMVDTSADGAFPGSLGHNAFLRGKTYFDAHYNIMSKSYDDTETNDNLSHYTSLPTLATKDYDPEEHIATAVSTPENLQNDSQKTLENGHVVIIRDGIRYSTIGTIIK